ncbi:MAG: DedA family protein, partial [Actinomycetota bacterium]|nr:DedA family protein [Actinomycetota bacterium]
PGARSLAFSSETATIPRRTIGPDANDSEPIQSRERHAGGQVEHLITQTITDTIVRYGYLAVFVLMVAESALIPVPSEVTMLFGGALANVALVEHLGATSGPLDFWVVGWLGAVGNLIGSWIAYAIGRTGGRALFERIGRYLLVRHHHLERAEVWFDRHGNAAVLIGRLLPVIRTFISLPAGIAEMGFLRFSIYTFVGCVPWSFGLALVGYGLGAQWERVVPWFRPVSIAIAAALAIAVIWWLYKALPSRSVGEGLKPQGAGRRRRFPGS